MTAILAGAVASVAQAQTVAQWDLLGAPGTQAFTPGTAAPNVTASNLARGAGLAGVSGANSLNTSGWDDLSANDFISFGFTAAPGFSVDLANLFIGTRSSATGPGQLGLFSSLDGFSTNLFTFSQPGTNFLNSVINLAALPNISGNVEFRIRALNNSSAGGGTIGSSGTFRVTAYFVGGTFDRNLQFTGTVIPTPGALALLGLAGLVAGRRRR
jgi:uncharacterized protein (TIGR03382 family)